MKKEREKMNLRALVSSSKLKELQRKRADFLEGEEIQTCPTTGVTRRKIKYDIKKTVIIKILYSFDHVMFLLVENTAIFLFK